MSLSVWSSSSLFYSSSSLPFIFTQPLVIYGYICKIITFKPWSYLREKGQKAPTFFQNKNYFTKTLLILFAKMACLIKKILLKRWYHVWCLVIQDLSSKFIYLLSCSNYLNATDTIFTFHDKWIMLSCQNHVVNILSSKVWPSHFYQSLNFSKFFCWLCTFLFYNILACVFFYFITSN